MLRETPLGTLLGCELPPRRLDRAALEGLFQWFMQLAIPYETVSNIQENVLIKDPALMARVVKNGGGGHCVEHASLFGALLLERGFDAGYVNADFIDHRSGHVAELARPYVVVWFAHAVVLCETYYRPAVLPVPYEGQRPGGERVRVAAQGTQIRIETFRGEAATTTERLQLRSGIEDRIRLFEARYRDFSPFGITAPYYQQLRPARRALYFVPEENQLLVQHGTQVRLVADDAIEEEIWVPAQIRRQLPAALGRNRQERDHAIAFLQTRTFLPQYRLLPQASREIGNA